MLVIQRPTVEPVGEQEGNRQKFAICPLEPGFGHTLGNSLRRTLLSSIPGAAITHVRFDTELHEFAPIKGVTEDATDVLLNLKDLVLVVHTDEPVQLRLDAEGPGPSTGHRRRHRDRTPTSRSSTPTSSSPPSTTRAASRSTSRSPRAAATCPRSATSAAPRRSARSPSTRCSRPVRRVAFVVEPTRVEMDTNYDRLVLDIETDGSITPREALASAGDTMRTLMAPRRRDERRAAGPRARRGVGHRPPARPTSTSRSRTSTCPSVPATA